MSHRILIIDDDTSVRHSLRRVLELSGYAVVHVPDSLLGVDNLKGGEIDLLLLDLDLPELKGWEVLEFAIEHRPEVPIVLLTGLMNQCAAGSFAGTDAVLEKPTDVQLLLQTLSAALTEPREQRLARIRAGFAKPPLLPGSSGIVPTPGAEARSLPAGCAGRSAFDASQTPASQTPVCDLS